MLLAMLMITVFFFVVMLILVIRHIRKIVVRPLNEETKIMSEYERSKDSEEASKQLGTIKTGNEIERLAFSFSSMVKELDRYMNELQTITAEKERIGAELDVATRIHADMLPNKFPAFPDRNEFDLYATMDPAKEVGGDFYDFFFVDNDHLAMVIADVSGKGIPAALFMMSAKIVINDRTMMGGTPAEILKYVNNRICDKNEEGLFVTVWLGIIDISTGKLTCANAGHEFPALCRNGKFELFKDEHGFVVGGFEDEEYTDYEIQLSPGDKIFVYTDGVPEATDAKGEMFNTDRMTESLNKHRDLSPEHLLKAVKEDVKEFVKDAPQFDDLTMLTLTFKGRTARKDGYNE
jgi:sigma-B regulation protein RsbU (phosphoserine phosphatase)